MRFDVMMQHVLCWAFGGFEEAVSYTPFSLKRML
jgi:hypothetical protein